MAGEWRDFYRIVVNNPPLADDFLSDEEARLGLGKQSAEEMKGRSAYDDLLHATLRVRAFRQGREERGHHLPPLKLAKVSAQVGMGPPGSIYAVQKGHDPHHCQLFGEKDLLAGCATVVWEEP